MVPLLEVSYQQVHHRAVALHAQLVLNGAVDEHQHEGCGRAEGEDGAHLGAGKALLGGEPDLEEGPPDAPACEEHQHLQGTHAVERVAKGLQ